MREFIMTKGLPGSGKTTWAEKLIRNRRAGRAIRVNRDLLRTMLHFDRFHGDRTELHTIAARNALIVSAMANEMPLIVSDDTNLDPDTERALRWLAEQNGYEFTVQDFTNVPLETCIKRDLMRARSVGEGVIRGMYKQWLKPAVDEAVAPEHDPNLPEAVIYDLDGTLAKMGDRGPYDLNVGIDTPVAAVVQLSHVLRSQGFPPIFLSGRSDACMQETDEWLVTHAGKQESDPLFMRADGDEREDSIIKEEIYRNEILGKYNIAWVVDDRNQVVAMWRRIGLTCLQVAEGDF